MRFTPGPNFIPGENVRSPREDESWRAIRGTSLGDRGTPGYTSGKQNWNLARVIGCFDLCRGKEKKSCSTDCGDDYTALWMHWKLCLFLTFYFILEYIRWTINNVVRGSGAQQRNPAIHIHVSVLPQTSLPSRLPYNIEQSSLWYTVGPRWLPFLNTGNILKSRESFLNIYPF